VGDVLFGDCRKTLATLPAGSVHCCVTSPPYWRLRDYGHPNQIGQEATPAAYVAALGEVLSQVRRVLRDDGTLWLNIGDSYANDTKWGGATSGKHARELHGDSAVGRPKDKVVTGLPPKCLAGMPWRVALALIDDGWTLRSDIIWHKPNPLPESVTDRPTKAHEYVFLLSKSPTYYYDAAAIAERATGLPNGNSARGRIEARSERNARSVWTIPTQPYAGSHFAVMPEALASRCILAGCPPTGTVLDPFAGSGTVGYVAEALGRHAVLCELNESYEPLIADRTQQTGIMFPGDDQGAA
jgi:DNA modification methylase